ncbi:MAG: CPBP family intramembrane metalloprotease [Rhodoferax sp.]|uniref:CPBP family intramembrane glutamic endopeptidase n=1 Tax=Rhodoferax sp. TaxID=50421 RepID=UPI0026271B22|nr:CPBP family intramembrane glutamic endopeptidase [Rhodoferax sp.]MDD2880460.1 CPBP family intramembrane metalloprotease [Rhodoferax sp.]
MMVRSAAPNEAVAAPASVLAFFVLAFAWSWSFWLLAPLLQTEAPVAATALALAGGFGPSLAAVAVVAYQGGRGGLRRWLSRCLQWRVGWRWLALAFFFPVGFMGLAAAAHVVLGGPLGEELGWRGYALPVLQRQWGWRIASLVLGGVWTLWHVPLFYSAGTVQSHLPMGLYALSAMASSVLFAWLFNRTEGSVLPVLVLHTAVNAWSLVIPVMVLPDGSNLRPFQLVVGILVFAALLLLFSPNPAPQDRRFSS